MKIVVAATGASGAIYLQRLLDRIALPEHEIHLVLSNYARQVIHEELGELRLPDEVRQHGDKSMNVPFVSGLARFDAMVIVPCSMGTLGRIAEHWRDDLCRTPGMSGVERGLRVLQFINLGDCAGKLRTPRA